MKKLIHSLSREALGAEVADIGQPAYRADQLWRWLYVQHALSWAEMKNLPRDFRDALEERFVIAGGEVIRETGIEGSTQKLLVSLARGENIEEVLLPAQSRRTVCVSSQVGCKIGCVFCASGQAGFFRDLETGEIVIQAVLAARRYGRAPSHIVFMGIGEPLDNYDNVVAAIKILHDPEGLDIGARRITISTSGIVPAIHQLASVGMQFELSVSLHAADDETRTEIMPLNKRYSVREVVDACETYTNTTKRIVTFEYTLIAGVNDSPTHLSDLVNLLRPIHCRVNLIPLSPIDEYEGDRSSPQIGALFLRTLVAAGVNTTLRDSKGRGMDAACGQLRSRARKEESAQDA